jgi:hypothetical protein
MRLYEIDIESDQAEFGEMSASYGGIITVSNCIGNRNDMSM